MEINYINGNNNNNSNNNNNNGTTQMMNEMMYHTMMQPVAYLPMYNIYNNSPEYYAYPLQPIISPPQLYSRPSPQRLFVVCHKSV